MTKRDITVDILRGIAIFTMIAANMGAYVLPQEHPMWFRFYGSFAAPLFIFLAGMMVVKAIIVKGYDMQFFLLRGYLIVTTGVLIDLLVWKIYPFTTYDVLYVIGLSMPLVYLFNKINISLKWIIIISILLITHILQNIYGYSDYPIEIDFEGNFTAEPENQTGILNHWLIDGWFPVFPWICFALLGGLFAKVRDKETTFVNIKYLITGVTLVLVGIIIMNFYPGEMLVREGYSEIFYPVTPGYVLLSLGIIVLLFYLVDFKNNILIYWLFKIMGRSSLLLYILHLVIIQYFVIPFWSEKDFLTFLLIYLGITLICLITALLAVKIKKYKISRNFLLKFYIGT